MSTQDFAKLPHPVANEVPVKPFKLTVPAVDIQKLHLLLDNLPIADANWENSQQDGRFGTTRDWLINAVKEWRHNYDWKKWEQKFNSYPQYTVDIPNTDGKLYTIRFHALFSSNANALPILFLHGWPGSFLEFLPILDLVKQKYPTPDSLPYHILVPDVIGFGFSSQPPLDKDFTVEDNARVLAKFMHTLGFTAENGGYVVQGGDLGGIIAPKIAALDAKNCRLAHLNMLLMEPPTGTNVEEDIKAEKYTTAEIDSLGSAKEFRTTGFAYALEHGTKPSTIGLALASSPVALLSWIGEKFLVWSDPQTTPSLELILTNVSIYWFSRCYPTSIWCYRAVVGGITVLRSSFDGVQCPMGYSWFRREISSPPKAWLDKIEQIKWYRAHEKGGHFAALEQPEALLQDVEDFIKDSGIQPRL